MTYPKTQTTVRAVLAGLFACALLLALPTKSFAMGKDSPGKVKFRGASFPIEEEAGEVTIVVKRQNGESGEVSVDWEVLEGTATDGEDYVSSTGTLTWDDGDRSDKTFTIEILDDDENEGQETFGLRLINPTGGVEITNPSTTTVRIKPSDRSDDDEGDDDDDGDDEDEDEAGFIKLTSASYPAYESAGVAEVTVERDGGSVGAVSIDFGTIPGSAEEGSDFTPANGTLDWADGETGEKTILVTLVDDAEAEGLETITIVLTNPTGGAQIGIRDVGSVIVVDDDGGEGSCVPDDETLCLGDGRFQVTGTWEDFEGNTGPFQWIPATDEAGLAFFFSESNVEFLIKILDGCPINAHYWVFYAATTNVGFEVEVEDLETGEVSSYFNPVGNIPLAVTDVTAFPTCGE